MGHVGTCDTTGGIGKWGSTPLGHWKSVPTNVGGGKFAVPNLERVPIKGKGDKFWGNARIRGQEN